LRQANSKFRAADAAAQRGNSRHLCFSEASKEAVLF
jgi:hypothetical protein